MNIFVNVKNTSGKSIEKKEYIIDSNAGEMTAKEFITLIVKKEVKEFNDMVMATSNANPDEGYGYLDKATVLKVFNEDDIEKKASSGKVSFDVKYNRKLQSEEEAVNNAIQSFKDGLVAVFFDGQRYDDPDEMILIEDGSEVTFVRLTFLAGRMW